MLLKHFAFVALTLGAFVNAAPTKGRAPPTAGDLAISNPSDGAMSSPSVLSATLPPRDNASITDSNSANADAAEAPPSATLYRRWDEDKWVKDELAALRAKYPDPDISIVIRKTSLGIQFNMDTGAYKHASPSEVFLDEPREVWWGARKERYHVVVFKGKASLRKNGADGGWRNWAWDSNHAQRFAGTDIVMFVYGDYMPVGY